MKTLCREPLSTGISAAGKSTFTPCNRKLYKDTGYCWDHALEYHLASRTKLPSTRQRTSHGARVDYKTPCVVCGRQFSPWKQRPGESCGRSCAAKLNMRKRAAAKEAQG